MMFSMGNIQNYVKSMELRQKWKLREHEEKQTSENQTIKMMREQLQKSKEQQSVGMIDQKLNSGKKLSAAEMDYLRDNHPELYAKARRIQAEREAYERELRRCRTKDEVRDVHMRRTSMLAGQAQDAHRRGDSAGCAEASQKQMAINDEHNIFIKSERYSALPKNQEELAKRRKKKALAPVQKSANASFLYDSRARKLALDSAINRVLGASERPQPAKPEARKPEEPQQPEAHQQKKERLQTDK